MQLCASACALSLLSELHHNLSMCSEGWAPPPFVPTPLRWLCLRCDANVSRVHLAVACNAEQRLQHLHVCLCSSQINQKPQRHCLPCCLPVPVAISSSSCHSGCVHTHSATVTLQALKATATARIQPSQVTQPNPPYT